MTNTIRTNQHDSSRLRGVALRDETFVDIQWVWCVFLAGQMALSFAFLAVTVWRTRRLGAPVVKSSQLAVMLAAPTDAMASS